MGGVIGPSHCLCKLLSDPQKEEQLKRKIITITAACLLFLLALGITLYPLFSTWYNERHQSVIHTEYMELVENTDNSALLEAKRNADAYNEAIVPGTQLEEAFSKNAVLSAAEDYDHQLNIGGDGIMGYIEIPLISVNLPIYHGTDSTTLDAGAGHLIGSSLPVGGETTHAVLTAHSGMASQKLFSDLDKLEYGDVFFVKVLGQTLAYQVDQINTVLPHDTTYLGIEEGEDLCTLVTCTPFAVNTHRLLVRGIRIDYEEAEVMVEERLECTQLPESTWEQEYKKGIFIGLGAVVVISVICLVLKFRRKGKYEAD